MLALDASALDQLPPTLTSEEVAELWRKPLSEVYRMARQGTAPVIPLRLGRSIRWPTASVLRTLGIEPDA